MHKCVQMDGVPQRANDAIQNACHLRGYWGQAVPRSWNTLTLCIMFLSNCLVFEHCL